MLNLDNIKKVYHTSEIQAIRLQGVGLVKAKPLNEFCLGEAIMWNLGESNEILSMTPSKTGKMITVELRLTDGRIWTKQMKATRLVAIGEVP